MTKLTEDQIDLEENLLVAKLSNFIETMCNEFDEKHGPLSVWHSILHVALIDVMAANMVLSELPSKKVSEYLELTVIHVAESYGDFNELRNPAPTLRLIQ